MLKGTDPDQLSSFGNHLVLWSTSVTGGACGERKNATNPMALSSAVVTWCWNPLMSAVVHHISMILFHSAARHVDFQWLKSLGICMPASITVALQRKMGGNYDSKVLAWKKEIEKSKRWGDPAYERHCFWGHFCPHSTAQNTELLMLRPRDWPTFVATVWGIQIVLLSNKVTDLFDLIRTMTELFEMSIRSCCYIVT